jgi:hypothetical protein
MDFVRQFLHRPFTQLGIEQQLLAALVVLCSVALAICATAFAARRIRPARVQHRRLVGRPVLISWRDSIGLRQSDDGFCRDVSDGGVALDLPFPLKVRTRLNLRVSEANLSGMGVVRHCTKVGLRFVVGVEFDRLTRSFIALS